MIICPNCGTENPDGSRFCGECGADLRQVASHQSPDASAPPAAASDSIPPQFDPSSRPAIPPQYAPSAPPGQPFTWSSTDAPPPPERKRRLWLWIVLGVIGACILFCCALTIYASTDSGEEFFSDLGTRLSDELTEVAPTSTPRR